MKRSEMRAKIAFCIAGQTIESGNVDIDLSWLSTDEIMKTIEEAGMNPPPHLISFFGVKDNAWEPEE